MFDFNLIKFEGNKLIINFGTGRKDIKEEKVKEGEEIVIGSLKERVGVIILVWIIMGYDIVTTGMWTTPFFAGLLISVAVLFFGAKGLLNQN